MKIFYAVQATGNGHISRATEILPYLQHYGEVDIFLSGNNATLQTGLPVKYRSKGVSFQYGKSGSLDYFSTAKKLVRPQIFKEITALPLKKYDLILNDFECLTSLACALRGLPSVHFGHQASFQSGKVPRPEKQHWLGEFILKNYATARLNIGLHFQPYDDFILPPVIRSQIREAAPVDKGFVSVYLPSFSDEMLLKVFSKIDFRFEIFSRETKNIKTIGNIILRPVSGEDFSRSLANCHGLISGAGFETPAEAMFLRKKMLLVPTKGQYEQYCNAAALKLLGISVVDRIGENFCEIVKNWLNAKVPNFQNRYEWPTEKIIEVAMEKAKAVM